MNWNAIAALAQGGAAIGVIVPVVAVAGHLWFSA